MQLGSAEGLRRLSPDDSKLAEQQTSQLPIVPVPPAIGLLRGDAQAPSDGSPAAPPAL